MSTTGTIRQGFGYWDYTHYPIGGCFRRAGVGGLSVTEIKHLPLRTVGCDACGVAHDEHGMPIAVAFNVCALEPADQAALA